MLNNNRFFESVSSTAIASIMIMISGLVTGSLIARLLGTEGRDELAYSTCPALSLASIAISGLRRQLPVSRTSTTNAGKYYLTGIVASIPIMFFGAVSAYLIIPHFLTTQPPVIISAARFYLFIVPLMMLPLFLSPASRPDENVVVELFKNYCSSLLACSSGIFFFAERRFCICK